MGNKNRIYCSITMLLEFEEFSSAQLLTPRHHKRPPPKKGGDLTNERFPKGPPGGAKRVAKRRPLAHRARCYHKRQGGLPAQGTRRRWI
jgi:hypothetical protein